MVKTKTTLIPIAYTTDVYNEINLATDRSLRWGGRNFSKNIFHLPKRDDSPRRRSDEGIREGKKKVKEAGSTKASQHHRHPTVIAARSTAENDIPVASSFPSP